MTEIGVSHENEFEARQHLFCVALSDVILNISVKLHLMSCIITIYRYLADSYIYLEES
jgi:hypothetical protein